MHKFSDIDPQSVVNDLCAEFRKIDALLGSPKHGLPDSFHKYVDRDREPPVLHITRYFRNIAALDKYEAFIERLDPFFLAIQYFTGKVQLSRSVGSELPKEYVDRFFCFLVVDAFRSSLDIYSKFLGCFFDFRGKTRLGFGYKQLIVPLKSHSLRLANDCNALYRSRDFVFLKSIRDAEKHEGTSKTHLSIDTSEGGLQIELERPQPLCLPAVEKSACICLNLMFNLLATTYDELSRWPLGYDSPRDTVVQSDADGYFRMP